MAVLRHNLPGNPAGYFMAVKCPFCNERIAVEKVPLGTREMRTTCRCCGRTVVMVNNDNYQGSSEETRRSEFANRSVARIVGGMASKVAGATVGAIWRGFWSGLNSTGGGEYYSSSPAGDPMSPCPLCREPASMFAIYCPHCRNRIG